MELPVRVVLVDDQPAIRRSVKEMLDNGKSIRVVGEAENGEEGLQIIDLLDPDMVIMDIEMPVMDGLEAASRIRNDGRSLWILILSGYNDRILVEEALKIGIDGYLLKEDAPKYLAKVVDKIAHGERGFFSQRVLSQLL